MFTNKKFAKKLGALVALAMIGGFSYSAVMPMASVEAAAISDSYDAGLAAMSDWHVLEALEQLPVKQPQNISKITISSADKKYLTSDFPIQKIGTAKTIKSTKSTGQIRYTTKNIVLTENVSRTNPKFTYIKKLPNKFTMNDVKGVGKQAGKSKSYTAESLGGWFGGDYGAREGASVTITYKDSKTTQVVLTIPNAYYNEQLVKVNDDYRSKKAVEIQKLRKTKLPALEKQYTAANKEYKQAQKEYNEALEKETALKENLSMRQKVLNEINNGTSHMSEVQQKKHVEEHIKNLRQAVTKAKTAKEKKEAQAMLTLAQKKLDECNKAINAQKASLQKGIASDKKNLEAAQKTLATKKKAMTTAKTKYSNTKKEIERLGGSPVLEFGWMNGWESGSGSYYDNHNTWIGAN